MKQISLLVILAALFLAYQCSSKKPTDSSEKDDNTPVATAEDSMALLDSATYSMGSSIYSGANDNEMPERSINLSPFYMDTTEITQQEYLSLTLVNPSRFKTDSLLPVESVTWYDAVLFCNAKSKRDGLDTVYSYASIIGVAFNGCTDLQQLVVSWNKNGYRLPTEAEWENGCRAQTISNFYWGNGLYGRSDTLNADSNAVWRNNSGNKTSKVASKKPNPARLYDMSGNVLEWCHDYYGNYESGEQTNPRGTATGSERVIRGGSWDSVMPSLRSAFRNKMNPSNRSDLVGFRCVRRKTN